MQQQQQQQSSSSRTKHSGSGGRRKLWFQQQQTQTGSSQRKQCTQIKANFWLQHVVDTSNDEGESGSFKQFWLAETGEEWPALCCLCGREAPKCGAHMFSIHPDIAGVVIVPACSTCNNNTSRSVKYASTKLKVWAAHVTPRELQRIERRQRATARYQRAEEQNRLVRELPAAGVPIPIHKQPPSPPRASTPLPPSPLTDPDVILIQAPRTKPLSPIGTRPSRAHNDDDDDDDAAAPRGFLADALHADKKLRDARAKCEWALEWALRRSFPSDDSDDDAAAAQPVLATPRPTRRREPAQPQLVGALQEVNRCKKQIDNDTKYCNSTVCSKHPACDGNSKVYCCAHCKCRNCKKQQQQQSK